MTFFSHRVLSLKTKAAFHKFIRLYKFYEIMFALSSDFILDYVISIFIVLLILSSIARFWLILINNFIFFPSHWFLSTLTRLIIEGTRNWGSAFPLHSLAQPFSNISVSGALYTPKRSLGEPQNTSAYAEWCSATLIAKYWQRGEEWRRRITHKGGERDGPARRQWQPFMVYLQSPWRGLREPNGF